MRSTRAYGTFAEFEREELRVHRNSAWSLDELVDDFEFDDFDLDYGDPRWEEEESEDEDAAD